MLIMKQSAAFSVNMDKRGKLTVELSILDEEQDKKKAIAARRLDFTPQCLKVTYSYS